MTPAQQAPRPSLLVPALIALLCLIWGSTWWAIRVCLGAQPPLSSAALRFLIAGAAMAALAQWLRRVDRGPAPPVWLWLATGTTSFAGSYGVIYVAEQRVPSGVAAVLWGIFPLLMAGSGVAWLGERLVARQWLGLLVSLAGIVVVFAGDLGAGPAAGQREVAMALLLLLSPVISAIGTTLVKRFGAGSSSVLLNRNGMLFGAVLLALAAFARESPLEIAWTAPAVVATLYLAIAGTAVTFGVYFWLLQRVPASRLALISYVTPVLAVSIGACVGDGTLGVPLAAGTALVVGGIALVVQKGKP